MKQIIRNLNLLIGPILNVPDYGIHKDFIQSLKIKLKKQRERSTLSAVYTLQKMYMVIVY